MRLKRKTYQENKEIKMNKTNKKQHPKKRKPTYISKIFFSRSLLVCIL